MNLLRSKTVWTALAALCTAVGMYVAGEIETASLVAAVFAAAGAIFLRGGVQKAIPAAAALLCVALLAGCGTLRDMVAPQDQTAGTSNNRSTAVAGGGEATWDSTERIQAGRRGGENVMKVPLRDANGQLLFDKNGDVVFVEIPGPVRDIYIAGSDQEFHAEVTQSGSSQADQGQESTPTGPAPSTTVPVDVTVPVSGADVPKLPNVPEAPAEGE